MRMSGPEAIMWAVERDPSLRSDFCNLTLLDCTPTDDRLRDTIERALDAIPRLRGRVVSPPVPIVTPQFAPTPDLDLSYHLRRVTVPAPGGLRELLDLCAALAEEPLDRDRPLWQFTVVNGLEGGRAAMLQKIHHTITDGVGGLRLSLAMVDLERDPAPGSDRLRRAAGEGAASAPSPRGVTRLVGWRDAVTGAASRGAGAAEHVLSGAGRTIAHPSELPARAAGATRLAASIQRQVLVADGARSDVLVDRSVHRHFEVASFPLASFRDAASRLGGSVNDVYVAGLCAALGRYHRRYGSTVSELRLAMPVSTRAGSDGASNRFAPSRTLVPIGPVDDLSGLFAAVRDRLAKAKAEVALAAAEGLAGLVSGLPAGVLVAMTRSQARTIDFGASNLRGSRVPLHLAGARILANFPFGPRVATPLNVTMLGYCEQLDFGFNIDPAAMLDVPAFMDDVHTSFAALLP
jgi:WS/DGAT/MGAT family acyltransferase